MEDNSEELIDLLEKQTDEFLRGIEDYSIAKVNTVKTLDEQFREIKSTAKQLNKLSKEFRKELVNDTRENE